eukprot:2080917-Pleurochrysis_carterae.AAC.1
MLCQISEITIPKTVIKQEGRGGQTDRKVGEAQIEFEIRPRRRKRSERETLDCRQTAPSQRSLIHRTGTQSTQTVSDIFVERPTIGKTASSSAQLWFRYHVVSLQPDGWRFVDDDDACDVHMNGRRPASSGS